MKQGELIYDIDNDERPKLSESTNRDDLNDLFVHSDQLNYDDPNEALDTPLLMLNLDDINAEAQKSAEIIAERLSDFYFDEKYITDHPYIKNKIAQEIDNIRRLLKMLSVNEKAQDALLMNIAQNGAKGSLYSSLTSIQNAMLSIQTQLNSLTNSLEEIFRTMQAECEKTFAEKDKENNEYGQNVVRGSKEFIKSISERVFSKPEIINKKTGEIIAV